MSRTDLNEPMLAVAAQRQADDDRISWRQADGSALPFGDAAFDVVCCQFGAMFFPDRIKAYGEVKRVLKGDGTFVFNVWDRIEDNVLTHEATVALEKLFPDDPPRFMVRTPHGYYDKAVIRTDLERAGFHDIAIETRSEISRAPSPEYVAIALCQGTPLRSEIEARDASKLSGCNGHRCRGDPDAPWVRSGRGQDPGYRDRSAPVAAGFGLARLTKNSAASAVRADNTDTARRAGGAD
ncbi:SAM-dependent methyltransferase [Bradyrhizobium sp. LB7.1]